MARKFHTVMNHLLQDKYDVLFCFIGDRRDHHSRFQRLNDLAIIERLDRLAYVKRFSVLKFLAGKKLSIVLFQTVVKEKIRFLGILHLHNYISFHPLFNFIDRVPHNSLLFIGATKSIWCSTMQCFVERWPKFQEALSSILTTLGNWLSLECT